MLVETIHCKTTNAIAEIYDDCVDPNARLDNDLICEIAMSDSGWLAKQRERVEKLKHEDTA